MQFEIASNIIIIESVNYYQGRSRHYNGHQYLQLENIKILSLGNGSIYRQICNISLVKNENLKGFSSRLAVVFAQSIQARC